MSMTSVERIGNILRRKPVDRIGVFENFWVDAVQLWTTQGKLKKRENLSEHFGLDIERFLPYNYIADLNFSPHIVNETEETMLIRDGNGATLRRHKLHVSTPEHVDYIVKDRKAWEKYIKPLLKPEKKRIDYEGYRRAKQIARKNNKFFLLVDSLIFEKMNCICGYENLFIGMAMDPDWITDMIIRYTDIIISLMEMLFVKEGCPDGLYFTEDLGFKGKSFISPQMYKELLQPAHKKIFNFAHSYNIPIIFHSCGFVEPLVPGFIEAGIDCLQPMEIKAGMNPIKLYKKYGERISFMGGMDITVLNTNDKVKILNEIESKIQIIKENNGYILQSDHSIPDTVSYETYKFFIQEGLRIGIYDR